MTKYVTRAAALWLALFLVSACSSTIRYALLGGRDHSTTEGEARFEERDEGGFTMSVVVDRLPTAERLEMPSAHYLVWIKTSGAETFVRAAELAVDERTRTGRAVANVPARSLQIRITAETRADAASPDGTVLVDAVLEPDE